MRKTKLFHFFRNLRALSIDLDVLLSSLQTLSLHVPNWFLEIASREIHVENIP
jgi:hypothetical protein